MTYEEIIEAEAALFVEMVDAIKEGNNGDTSDEDSRGSCDC